jgi:hypothetical protein
VAIAVLGRGNYFAPQTTRANEVLISTQAGGSAVHLPVKLRKNNRSQTMGFTSLAETQADSRLNRADYLHSQA